MKNKQRLVAWFGFLVKKRSQLFAYYTAGLDSQGLVTKDQSISCLHLKIS